MKICIGTNIKDGPWGGGNLFAINLRDYLIENNHEVVTNLNDDDIDIKVYKNSFNDWRCWWRIF